MAQLFEAINFVLFLFDFVCRALSLSVKDIIKIAEMKDLFKRVLQMASRFKNVDVTSFEL